MKKNRFLYSVLFSFILMAILPIHSFADATGPEFSGNKIYGNGYPLQVRDGEEGKTTVLYDGDGNGSYESTLVENVEGALTIYGGGNGKSFETSSVKVEGGNVETLYCAGYAYYGDSANVTTATVVVLCGNVGTIYCGGYTKFGNDSSGGMGGYITVSTANITVSGGEIDSIYASSAYTGRDCESTVTSANITISGGTIGSVNRNAGKANNAGSNDVLSCNLKIVGGSIRSKDVNLTPVNLNGASVVLKELEIHGENDSAFAEKEITVFEYASGNYDYGLQNVKTDSNGKLYVYMPDSVQIIGMRSWDDDAFVQKENEPLKFKLLPPVINWPELQWASDLQYGKAWKDYITNYNSLTGSVSLGGNAIPGTFSIVEAESNPDVGNRNFTIKFISNDGKYIYTKQETKEITKADISISSAQVATKTYDGTTDATLLGITFEGADLADIDALVEGTDYTVSVQYDSANASSTATATVTVTLKGAAYYHYNLTSNTFSATGIINKAEITPQITIEDWTYGEQANTPVITGNTGNGAVTISYSFADSHVTTEGLPTNVGYYIVYAEIEETANYKECNIQCNLHIDQNSDLVIDGIEIEIKPYDGTTKATVKSVTFLNFELTADVDYDVSAEFEDAEIGNTKRVSVRVELKGDARNNFSHDTFNETAFSNIVKGEINPTVVIESRSFGDEAKAPSVTGNLDDGTVSYSYKVKGADDSTYTDEVPTKVGEYTVRATIGETIHYNEKTVTADFIIGKARQTAQAPTMASKGINSITLNKQSGFGATKYGISKTTALPSQWQDSETFNGLTANTEYFFFVKYLGNEVYEEAVSAGTSIRTAEDPKPKTGERFVDEVTKATVLVLDADKKEVSFVAPADAKAKKIKIPASVTYKGDTYTVVAIGDKAFKGNKTVTSITLPKSLITIGKEAFSGCTKLKTLSLTSNVTTIGVKAFYKCTSLGKITIPAKVSSIGKQAFEGCKNLKSITIKTTKLTSKNVGAKAFKGISTTATVKVPKNKLKDYTKLLKSKGISGKKQKIKK